MKFVANIDFDQALFLTDVIWKWAKIKLKLKRLLILLYLNNIIAMSAEGP